MIIRRLLFNERGDGTMVLMTTLNMLLLAFFIVLNSFSVLDDNKIKKAWGSLLGSLGILTGGLTPGMGESGQTLPRSVEMALAQAGMLAMMVELESFAAEEKLMKNINITHGNEGVRVSITNKVTFEDGQSTLKPVAKDFLRRVAKLATKMTGELNIIGHTSPGLPGATGPYPDDWTLSFARAGAAARFLIDDVGINPNRVSVSGYGSVRPIVENDTPRHIRLNNRLEIVMIRGGTD